MTDRQRAFIAALAFIVKNSKFTSNHRVGVKRIPDGAYMYEFRGEWLKDSLSILDDKYNRVYNGSFYEDPWGVKARWQGKLGVDDLMIRIPVKGSNFYGHGDDYARFEGTYYAPSYDVEIRDQSQDRYKYVYRITW